MGKAFVLSLLAGCLTACGSAFAGEPLKPPVIHERFTVLPCPLHPKDRDIVGCTEKRILATDREINLRVMTAFKLLMPKDRASFVRGEKAWFRYRLASCQAETSKYFGGSAYSVYVAECLESRNRTHLGDLAELVRVIGFH